jgi:hypothetical protein
MRAAPLVLILLCLIALAVGGGSWLLLGGSGGPPAPAAGPGDDGVDAPRTAPHAADGEPGRAALDVGVMPAAQSPVRPQPPDLADHVTAWLVILDAATGKPVPAAAVYRFAPTEEAAIAYSDAKGIVPLPLRKGGQLMVAHVGYLMRLAPTLPGSTAELPQQVQLEPDRYCSRCALRFRRPDGSVPDEVFVRLRPQRGGTADQPMPAAVTAGGEAVQRAWREQRTLAAVRAVPELHVQLGLANAAFVHQLAGDDEVAFVESGLFELDAATVDGFVARAVFDTAEVARTPLTVRMLPGQTIAGVLRGPTGQPVADALLTIAGSDPLRLQARSAADGRFVLGPLADGSYGLEVRHRDFEVARPGPFAAGSHDVVVALTQLPQSALRGRVRMAGVGTPLANARATVIDNTGQPLAADTDADGFFALRAGSTESQRLTIAADGYLPHAEFVDPGAQAIDVELWPRDAEKRRELGLTGFVQGVVLDERGAPVAGAGVRLQSEAPAPAWLPGRRIISGGLMSVPRMATTAGDGSFALETATAGPGSVSIVGAPAGEAGVRVVITLGQTVRDLRVVTRRPR